MKHFILSSLFLLMTQILFGQIILDYRVGEMVNQSTITSEIDDGVLKESRLIDPFTDGGFIGIFYQYFTLRYQPVDEPVRYSLRYNYLEYSFHLSANYSSFSSLSDRWSESTEIVYSISFLRGHSFQLSKRLYFDVDYGLGLTLFDSDPADMGSGSSGSGSNGEYFEINYVSTQPHKVVFFVPMEASLRYQFSKFLSLNFHMGYSFHPMRFVNLDLEYVFSEWDEPRYATLKSNFSHVFIGVGAALDIGQLVKSFK